MLARKHWARIIQRWPVDRVRPENVSFQKIMQDRLKAHPSKPSQNAAAKSIEANAALVSATEPRKWDEAKEAKQANALYSLLEDRYAHQYPLPDRLRYPDFNPEYYDELCDELEEAPGRTPFERMWLKLKGRIRFA
ncbi:MAG: hypothetical protein Q9227_003980 [Pyrenula ochraceoflavens]